MLFDIWHYRRLPDTVIRFLVIAGVIIGAGVVPFLPSQRISTLLLVAIVGTGAFIILSRAPPLGILALIPASMVIPFTMGTGTQTKINAPVLLIPVLTALWLGEMAIRKREIRLIQSKPILPLTAFVLTVILAFGIGQLPWYLFAKSAPLTSQLGGLAIFMFSGALFLVVAHQVKDPSWLQKITWTFLILGGGYIFARVIPQIGSIVLPLYTTSGWGSLFWNWIIAMAFSQAWLNKSLPIKFRGFFLGIVVAAIYVTLFQGQSWSSGWVPGVIAILIILWISTPKIRLPAVLLTLGIVLFYWSKVINFVMVGDNTYSLFTRIEAWKIVGEIVKANPFLGLGPSNYYWYTPLFPILGYAVRFNSHNNYVDIIAQSGIIGLFCFLWFAWEVGRLGWKHRNTFTNGFSHAYVYGALGGLAGTLVAAMLGDWVIPFVYNVGLEGLSHSMYAWIFLGGLVSLEQWAKKNSGEGSDPII